MPGSDRYFVIRTPQNLAEGSLESFLIAVQQADPGVRFPDCDRLDVVREENKAGNKPPLR